MIPKIIHYCWLSDDEIPENLRIYMKSWEKLQDYQFIKWDLKKFDINSSRWVKEAFENKKYAFACDYIRLYAVYHYGGIYMDMDIEVIKKFDDLLNKPYMFARERPDIDYIEAGCFGAEKENPFLKSCLKYYEDRAFVMDDGTFDMIPLPKIMHSIKVKECINLELYSNDYFTCKSFENGLIATSSNTYAIHHFAGSWKTEKEQKIINETQHLSRYVGYYLARNFVEYKYALKNSELIKLTLQKIKRKIKR